MKCKKETEKQNSRFFIKNSMEQFGVIIPALTRQNSPKWSFAKFWAFDFWFCFVASPFLGLAP